MKRIFIILFLCIITLHTQATVYKKVDMAICADLSTSTKGLLDALRTNMWYLMHYLTVYEPQPAVRIGMVCYGQPGYLKENDYTKIFSDLSTRINLIQSELYKTVNGEPARESAPESALLTTINSLSWSKEPDAFKTIYFIGNGMLHSKYYNDIVKAAKKKGITINVMYYNSYKNVHELASWTALAKELNTELILVEPSLILPLEREIKSANSDIILEANKKYNNTFIYYGEHGQRDYNQFLELDRYARETGMHCQEFRLLYKISDNYLGANKSWDLVDLSIKGELDTNNIEKKFLPEMYRKMSGKELLAAVERKKEERMYLREIATITAKRNVILTHDYYQEFKAIIRQSLYIIIMQKLNEQVDNVHLIMD